MRFSVWVNHDSTFELRTMVGAERGANAAAEAGSRLIGMAAAEGGSEAWIYKRERMRRDYETNDRSRAGEVKNYRRG